jgi:hypothetical protein
MLYPATAAVEVGPYKHLYKSQQVACVQTHSLLFDSPSIFMTGTCCIGAPIDLLFKSNTAQTDLLCKSNTGNQNKRAMQYKSPCGILYPATAAVEEVPASSSTSTQVARDEVQSLSFDSPSILITGTCSLDA